MNIQIINRFTNEVIFEHDAYDNSVGDTVEFAVKRGIDLSSADLSEADLYGLDLYGAKLKGAQLLGANLYRTNLDGADLSFATMQLATLVNASMKRVNLRYAVLTQANLSAANLIGANLDRANLDGAVFLHSILSGASIVEPRSKNFIGDGTEIKSMQLGKYSIAYIGDYIHIGCRRYTAMQWASFTDEEISKMDAGALEWWNTWKEVVLKVSDID